jgi:thiopurine S-methyltransferase
MHSLLVQTGTLAGLLFNFPLTDEGPPFGGDAPSYQQLFEPSFKIHRLEPCLNSIKPRLGKELFFILEKAE